MRRWLRHLQPQPALRGSVLRKSLGAVKGSETGMKACPDRYGPSMKGKGPGKSKFGMVSTSSSLPSNYLMDRGKGKFSGKNIHNVECDMYWFSQGRKARAPITRAPTRAMSMCMAWRCVSSSFWMSTLHHNLCGRHPLRHLRLRPNLTFLWHGGLRRNSISRPRGQHSTAQECVEEGGPPKHCSF